MTHSPQQFVEWFISEQKQLGAAVQQLRRPFEERFFDTEYSALHAKFRAAREEYSERILETDKSGDTARVITSGPGGVRGRFRYHLQRSGETWRISEVEWECFACRGTGTRGDKTCEVCGGAGWKDPLKEKG
jgi:hypothetical protein